MRTCVPHHTIITTSFEITAFTMPLSKEETQRQTILQLWNNGIRNAKQIHTQTSIPLSTVYGNIKKLKNIGTTQHAKGAERTKKLTQMRLGRLDSMCAGILRFLHELLPQNCPKLMFKYPMLLLPAIWLPLVTQKVYPKPHLC